MLKIFLATTMVGSLICGSAHAGCNGGNERLVRGETTLQQELAVEALLCAGDPVKAKPAAYRFEEGRQADANFLTLLVLLKMQSLSEQNKHSQ